MSSKVTRDTKIGGDSRFSAQQSLPLLGGVLALVVAGYAVLTRDREMLGQVWELSKYLICSVVIGPVLRGIRA